MNAETERLDRYAGPLPYGRNIVQIPERGFLTDTSAGKSIVISIRLTSLFQIARQLLFLGLIILAWAYYKDRWFDWDEMIYMDYIDALRALVPLESIRNIFSLYETEKFSAITSLPTYFVFLAYIAKLSPTYQVYRLVNVLLLFVSGVMFEKCREIILAKKGPERASEKGWTSMLGFMFFPVIFTMAFLIYNDFTVLALVLIAFFLEIKGKYTASALLVLFACLIRQTTAPWFALVPFLAWAMDDFKLHDWRGRLLNHWASIAGLLLACTFFVWNHGVSMGDKNFQSTGNFSVGNVINFYFFAALFFLPSIVSHMKSHFISMRSSPFEMGALLAVVLGAFWIHVHAPLHAYNGWLEHRETVFLRNWIVHLQIHSMWFQVLSIALVTLGFMELWSGTKKAMAIALCFAVLVSLAPFNVIDIRYAIIPLMFHLLLRKAEPSKAIWYTQLGWQTLLSIVWFIGVRESLWTPF